MPLSHFVRHCSRHASVIYNRMKISDSPCCFLILHQSHSVTYQLYYRLGLLVSDLGNNDLPLMTAQFKGKIGFLSKRSLGRYVSRFYQRVTSGQS